MATIVCGWCNTKSHLTATSDVAVTNPAENVYNADASFTCDACHRMSVVSWTSAYDPRLVHDPYRRDVEPEDWMTAVWHPHPGTQRDFPDVPDGIGALATEAWLCQAAGAPRGSGALARAVIEATAKMKGATSGGLDKKIDQLAAEGLIRRAVADQAHEIRLLGNTAAHGDLDSPITVEEAEEALHLMAEVLNEVWQSPARSQRLAARRAAAKDSKSGAPADE